MIDKASCGAMIFRRKIDKINKEDREDRIDSSQEGVQEPGPSSDLEILLVHYGTHHWGFPKGRMEEGETEEETALRETLEETQIRIRLMGDLRLVSSYLNHRGETKTNIFFLASPLAGQTAPVPQLSEVSEAAWWPLDKARKELTFPGDQALFDEGLAYLKKRMKLLLA